MITTLTIKQLAANKLRLLATAFAVILGVAFLAGTLILTDTIEATFDNVLTRADAGTDAYIRAASPLALGYGQTGHPLDATLIDTIRNIDGVDKAAAQVSGYAQIVDKAGKAVGKFNPGVRGMNWVTVPELNPFTVATGRAPVGPDEIATDQHYAKEAGLQVGDTTTVLSKGEPRPVTLVGTVRFGKADRLGAFSVVLFDDVTAQAVLNAPGQIDAIAVTARPGVSPDSLVARLAPVVGASNQAISGATLTKEHQDRLKKDISQFGTFLTIFALIAVFVGAFIINNTFSIIVSQRTKEMALLRAVGATGRQVRSAVLAEAAVTGVVASAVGLLAGMGVAEGIKALMAALGVKIPIGTMIITSATVATSMIVGVVVTIASAVMPARRASKVPPIAALRDVAQDRSAVSKRRIIIGTTSTVIAIATLLMGLSAGNAKVVGLGALGLFLAVSVLGPVLARPVAAVLGYPIARFRGTAGLIARQNAIRNPKRTARTAASLMIGVALVGFLSIFASSIKASGAGTFRNDFHGTVVVDSGALDGTGGLSPSLAANVATQTGVHTISAQRTTAVEINGNPAFLNAYDTSTIGTLFNLGHIEGDLTRLGADGIAVKAGTGPDAPHLGDTRTITFPTGTSTFTVRATYDHGAGFFGDRFVDLTAFEANLATQLDARVYVDADNISVVDHAAAGYPTAKVLTTEAFITEQNGSIDTILTLMYALLGLAVLIALLGIANTLALSIHERKRELGLLRAVGMSRAQVRSSVRWESAIIALFGTGLGLVIGAFLGWAMVHALADQGLDQLVIPGRTLAIVTVIASLAGVGASLMPSRRAARIDILKAVATA
jgi:putative ABC transport system permease protein